MSASGRCATSPSRSRLRNAALAVVGGAAALTLVAALAAVVTGGDATVATSTPAQPLVTELPQGFPLAAGYPRTNQDLSPVTVVADVPMRNFRLCSGRGFTPDASALTATAAAAFSGAAGSRARLLTVWADEPSAEAAVQSARDTLAACAADDGVTTERRTDYDLDALAFTRQSEPGADPARPGLEVYEVVRVRNVVYLSYTAGEGAASEEAAIAGVERAAESSAAVLAAAAAVFGQPADATASTG